MVDGSSVGASVVCDRLRRTGITAAVIHGNKSQSARQQALESFRSREVSVLVATDIAARGIDIDGISHVINFDLPVDAESYVHRIGRTGRAGADGIALSFCTDDEYDTLRSIEKLLGRTIPSMNARPTGANAAQGSGQAGRSGQPGRSGQAGRSGRPGQGNGASRGGRPGSNGPRKRSGFAGSGSSR